VRGAGGEWLEGGKGRKFKVFDDWWGVCWFFGESEDLIAGNAGSHKVLRCSLSL